MTHTRILVLGAVAVVAIAAAGLTSLAGEDAPRTGRCIGSSCSGPNTASHAKHPMTGASAKMAKSKCAVCAAGKPCATCAASKPAKISGYLVKTLIRLDEASRALKAGDKKAASQAIAEARKLVATSHKAMELRKAAPKKGPVNTRCPIMGGKIDPEKVPAALVRSYNGQKVGFCCGSCPMAWEKLTDAQKDAALKKSTGDTLK